MNSLLKSGIILKSNSLVAALLASAMILAACAPAAPDTAAIQAAAAQDAGSQAAAAPAATRPAEAAMQAETQAEVDPTETAFTEPDLSVIDNPVLGPILAGVNGMTLYIFTRDTPDQSTCSGECLEMWMPLLTRGQPLLGAGVNPAMVGSAPLADGFLVVTYNHMPLYHWYQDVNPGDATGQGVDDAWYVVSPDGAPLGLASTDTSQNDDSDDDNGYDKSDY